MRSLPTVFAAVVLGTVLILYMCTYQVRSTEVAIIKTYGKADPTTIEVADDSASFFAGLRFRAPWPIQSVEKYDKRLRLLEDRIEETPTRDNKQIILTTYTAWTIVNPYEFHKKYQTIEAGEQTLRSRIRTVKKAIVGQYNFSNFVSLDPADRKLEEIEKRMLADMGDTSGDGVEIKLFGIRQLTLPESVTKKVFETMKADKENAAKRYQAEGEAEANRIIAEAEVKAQRIRAAVDRKVRQIEAKGQEQVGAMYAEFKGNPELRIFLDKLQAMEDIMSRRTEIFMDTNSEPFDLFDEESRAAIVTPAAQRDVLKDAIRDMHDGSASGSSTPEGAAPVDGAPIDNAPIDGASKGGASEGGAPEGSAPDADPKDPKNSKVRRSRTSRKSGI